MNATLYRRLCQPAKQTKALGTSASTTNLSLNHDAALSSVAEDGSSLEHRGWIVFSEDDVKGGRRRRECQAAKPRIPSTR